jgi:hypothetical protein
MAELDAALITALPRYRRDLERISQRYAREEAEGSERKRAVAATAPDPTDVELVGQLWQPLIDLDRNPPGDLVLGRLPPREHTILYGPGDVGKGTVAADWIVAATRAGLRVLIADYESHPGEWARRIFDLGGIAASEAVAYANPVPPAYPIGSLEQHAQELRRAADATRADLIVIDSVSAACRADPLEPTTAWRYQAAVMQLGRTVLSLAHVTKAHEMTYPFGSVMWHNAARMTYSLERVTATTLKLRCRKSNNYRKPADVLVTPEWIEDRLREVGYRDYTASIADRIADVLADGVPRTQTELRDELDSDGESLKESAVRMALSRNVGPMGRFAVVRSRYSLRDG